MIGLEHPALSRAHVLFIFVVAVLISMPVLAGNDAVVEVEKIVVTAHLTPSHERSVGSSLDVITGEEIQQKQFTHVGQILNQISGVQTISTGSPGDDLDIRIRGSDRDEVLVLLDGVPINNLTETRALILNSIPVDLIERVEVIRGAHSVIYGSSAVAGVVNIITDKGRKTPTHWMSFDAGNLGLFKETLASSGKHSKHSYATSFSRHDQSGRFDNDRYGANNFFTNYSYDFSDQVRLEFGLFYSDQKQELAHGSATSFVNFPRVDFYSTRDHDRFIDRNILMPRMQLKWKASDFYEAQVSYGLYYEDIRVSNSNQNDMSPDSLALLDSQLYDSEGHRHNFDLRNTFHFVDRSQLNVDVTLGMSGQLEFLNYTDAPFPGDATPKVASSFPDANQQGFRRSLSGFGEVGLNWTERFYLGVGVRFEDNETYGQAVSPRVSLSYFNPATHTKFFTTFSQGFVAPTLNQYYLAVIGGTLTQRLDKETSQTFEIGFKNEPVHFVLPGRISFGTTFFYTNYDTTINELQLIDNAHVAGFETMLDYEVFTWLNVNANYTFLSAINDDTGTPLANQARHQFYGEIRVKPVERFSFVFGALARSHRPVSSVLSTALFGDLAVAFFDENGSPSGSDLPAYFLLNAAVEYRLPVKTKTMKELRFSLKANNLLNTDYQERFGYEMPKFNFVAGFDLVL